MLESDGLFSIDRRKLIHARPVGLDASVLHVGERYRQRYLDVVGAPHTLLV